MNIYKEFDKWKKTEGLISNDMTTLTGQPYLENRLCRAFMAGWVERDKLSPPQEQHKVFKYKLTRSEKDKLKLIFPKKNK